MVKRIMKVLEMFIVIKNLKNLYKFLVDHLNKFKVDLDDHLKRSQHEDHLLSLLKTLIDNFCKSLNKVDLISLINHQ